MTREWLNALGRQNYRREPDSPFMDWLVAAIVLAMACVGAVKVVEELARDTYAETEMEAGR